MKKIFYLFALLLFVNVLQAQTVSEKLILKIDNQTEADGYSVKYDEATGTYLYMLYDSTKQYKNMILSNMGNSGDYDYIDYFNAIIDKQGNYYTIANKSINDTIYSYSFLKNGKELASYGFMNSELLEKDGIIYFLCSDKGKSFISEYNIPTGTLTKGKTYNEIIPCKMSKAMTEGEPYGKLGFTKSGKLFYIAKSNNKTFLVVGGQEKKRYSDIDAYSLILDESDRFFYVAKDTGSFMYFGGNFVVCDDKEYKRFNSIFNLTLDKNGNPVYIAFESTDDLAPQRVISGNKPVSKEYNGGVYNLGFTPDGRMYYIANEKKKKSEDYDAFIVFDGKEGKRYQSVYNIKVTPENELIYIAQKNEKESALMIGGKEIKINQSNVMSMEILEDGKLAFIGVNYGNYDKHIKDEYYINIGGKESGPFDIIQFLNYENSSCFISDKEGNCFFLVNNFIDENEYSTLLRSIDGWKSGEFNYIQDVYLYKGKPIYTGTRLVDKDKFLYKYGVYYGSDLLTKEFDGINEFKFDEKTGTAAFLVAKANEIYKVEIKF
jgi:hypothetical protein